MDITTLIKTRRSIRRYKPKKVPRKLLKKVLDSARWAPSLHNIQPWKFIIPEGRMKEKLLQVLKKRRGKELIIVRLTLKSGVEIVEKAPVVILVYNDAALSKRIKKGGMSYLSYFNSAKTCEIQSVACAIQNMLLTAHSLGLGAACLGISMFRENEINKLFGVEDRLMAIITMGYPAEKPKVPPRKKLYEITSFRK